MIRAALVAFIAWPLAFAVAQSAELSKLQQAGAPFQRGMTLRSHGDLPGALDQFRRAARIDPELPHVHREIGLILIEQRAFRAAADELRIAARQDANDFDSRYDLALSLANAGDLAAAEREASILARERPRWGAAHYGLGHIYALSGSSEAAAREFQLAVGLDPNSWRAWFELGKLLEDSGDRDGAINALKGAIRANPDAAAARYRLAVLLKKSGETESAGEEFAAARSLREKRTRGEQAAAAYRQGLEKFARSDYEGAVTELRLAAELRPDFAEIRTALKNAQEHWGLKLEQSGQLTIAMERYADAIRAEATAETQNHLGVLQARMGRITEAIASFRAALELDPQFRNARKNLDQALALQGAGGH